MTGKDWNDKIAIGGWVTPWPSGLGERACATVEAYRDAKECGIDFLHTLYENGNDGDLLHALDCAERAGVLLYIHDSRFFKGELSREEGHALIEKFSQKSSFLGLNVRDEPCENDFNRLRDVAEEYGNACECFVNLLPVYAIGTQLKDGVWKPGKEATEEEYESYLEGFVKAVPVRVLSYDFYPFKTSSPYGDVDQRYFYQLCISKKTADRMEVPLWNFVQVTAFNNEIRVMTESEIFWCVTTSVAFGVTGLQYFTYFTPIDTECEKFKGAIIDGNGNKTVRYDYAKRCNAHLNALGGVLVGAQFKGVIASGEYSSLIPDECRLASFGDVEVAEGEDYIVGCFEKQGRRSYYLVNSSLEKTQKYTLKFKNESVKNAVINDENIALNKDVAELELLPGRAALIY